MIQTQFKKKNQTKFSKLVTQISKNKTETIEFQAKKYLSSIFSKNQLDLMMKKKNKELIGPEMKFPKRSVLDISANVLMFLSRMNLTILYLVNILYFFIFTICILQFYN